MNQSNNGVLGNSIDIKIDPCNQAVEIRADVKVEEFITKRIWGQIVNCNGRPIANTLVKLVKIVKRECKYEYIGMAHTVTDCEGFYQFDVCAKEESDYKIIVNKAVVGDEIVLDTDNCSTCVKSSYDPCKMPNRYIVDSERFYYQEKYEPCRKACEYEQVFDECIKKPKSQNYASYTR